MAGASGARILGVLVFVALVAGAYAAPILAASPGSPQGEAWSRSCTIHIVAVSSSGGGVLGNLTVTIHYPGRGRVFISTSPATQVDTQGSARLAAFAASLLAGVDMTKYDFYYELEAPSIIVGGPSAGAAMALATLDLLLGAPCNSSVDVTGMIQPDTSIGPVGGLKEKLEAAARGGAKLFIVPAGQEVYTYYEERYERLGPFVWVVREPVTVNLTEYGEKLGVRVATAASLLEEFELAAGTRIPSNPHPQALPEWFIEGLKAFISRENRSIAGILAGLESSSPVVEKLRGEALKYLERVSGEVGRSEYYMAAVDAVTAEAYAWEALYLSNALKRGLDVTEAVRGVNTTLLKAWEDIHAKAQASRGAVEYLLLARAYGKLGVAAYYYREALNALDEYKGRYYVPTSFFGGMDLTGLEYLSTARALADWALFWLNLTSEAPKEPSVSPGRLRVIANLLLSEARTSVAYTTTLLKESGAGAEKARLATALADEALASRDPVAVIGLSIESIAEATRAIHETFTLKPLRTARQLDEVAAAVTPPGDSGAVSLALIKLSQHSSEPVEKLIAASRAVLYAWLERELVKPAQAGVETGGQASANTAITSTNTQAPPQGVTGTKTSPSRGPGINNRLQRGEKQRLQTYLSLAALLAAVAALVYCASTRRPPA